MPGMTTVLTAIAQQILFVLGIVFVLLLFVHMVGPKIPILNRKLGDWNAGQLIRYIDANVLMLIQQNDGNWSLVPAEYDHENTVYWAEFEDGKEPFDAEGVGPPTGSFYGVPAVAAYRGLGAYEDMQDGEIEIEGRVAEEFPEELRQGGTVGRLGGIWYEIMEKLGRAPTPRPTEETRDDADQVHSLGRKTIVDLRQTLYNAPFHIRPEAFHRVEKNAQKQGGGAFGDLGATGQALLIMMAMGLGGLMIWFVMSGGSGGGGGLPFMLVPL